MDILNPLDNSEEVEEIESKVIISQNLSIVDDQGMESDEDNRAVDHLSPQTLMETPADGDVQFAFRSPEGTITYRVLQVDEGSDNVSQIVSNSNFPNSGIQPVLTSGLYVIGNEIFNNQATSNGTRAIAPRASIMESNSTLVPNLKKRDERRRVTHNEVERRRRDKINNWITKLSKIIPEKTAAEMKGNGHYDGQSKGGILAKACQYIQELKEENRKLDAYIKDNKQVNQSLDFIKQKNLELERENRALKEILKRNGMEVSTEVIGSS